jgi:hypothetical protein
MSAAKPKNPDIVIRRRGVGIEVIGLIIGSVLLGVAATVFVLRSMAGGIETVSVTGLLNLLVTIGLATAAIVLAVVAISLSRMAERSILKKAEELNALQTATIAQTSRAIERMEEAVQSSSEQIAGTLYDSFELFAEHVLDGFPTREQLCAEVSHAFDRSMSQVLIGMKDGTLPDPSGFSGEDDAQEPEEVIESDEDVLTEADEEQPEREEIRAESPAPVQREPDAFPDKELSSETTVEQPAAGADEDVTAEEAERKRIDKKYDEFKDIVLLGVANFPGVIVRKIGEGHYRTEGDDLVDGAFSIKNERVAVCTFCTNHLITDRFTGDTGDSFFGFLKSLFNELKCGRFDRVFMVFDSLLNSDSPYAKALNEMNKKIDPDTFSLFELFEGSPDSVIPELTERVSQLMDRVPDKPEDKPVPDLSFRHSVN